MDRNKIIRILCILSASVFVLTACTKQPVTEPETTTQAPVTTQTTEAVTEPASEQYTQQEATTQQEESSAIPTESETAVPVTQTRPHTTPVTKPQTILPETTAVPEASTVAETTTAPLSYPEQMLFNANTMAGYFFISKDEIADIAGELADDSRIYYVRLQDGTDTFYMAVDLQTAQALALANPQVLRAVCRNLDEAQKQQAAITQQDESSGEYLLMDYTHLVGELQIHFVGYLLTGALGGENGPLASFYNSCKIADLNVDESRFGPIIDIIGTVAG